MKKKDRSLFKIGDQAFYWRFCFQSDNRNKRILTKKHHSFIKKISEEYKYCLAMKVDYFDYESYAKIFLKSKLPLLDTLYSFKILNRGNNFTKEMHKNTLLIADFDSLPSRFSTWEDFLMHCQLTYSDSIVLKSPSNKVKVLFLVEQDQKKDDPDSFSKNRKSALKRLIADDELIPDEKHSTTFKIFLTDDMIQSLLIQLPIAIFKGKISELSSHHDESKPKDISKSNHRRSRPKKQSIDLAESSFHKIIRRDRRKDFKKFLSCLLSYKYLDTHTAIPCKKIAEVCNKSLTTIYSYLDLLKHHGLLSYPVSSYSYTEGVARELKLEGGLLDLYLSLLISTQETKESIRATIKDGNWNDPLFKLTNCFMEEEDYLAYCRGIEGIEKRNRLEKAKQAWRRHLERGGSQIFTTKKR